MADSPRKERAFIYAGAADRVYTILVWPHDTECKIGSMGPQGMTARAIGIFPFDARTALVGTDAAGPGLCRGTSAGAKWEEVPGWTGGRDVQAVVYHPTAPSLVIAGTSPAGIFISDTSGAWWTESQSASDLFKRLARHLNGRSQRARICSVAFDPGDPDVVLAAAGSMGMVRSTNGGKTWDQVWEGPEDVVAVTFWPGGPGIAIAVTASEVLRTADNGATWAKVLSLPGGAEIVCAHGGRAEPFYLYLAVRQGQAALYVSKDGGKSWAPGAAGLPEPLDGTDTLDSHEVLAGVIYYGASIGKSRFPGRIYMSEDAGDTWEPLDVILPEISCLRAGAIPEAERLEGFKTP